MLIPPIPMKWIVAGGNGSEGSSSLPNSYVIHAFLVMTGVASSAGVGTARGREGHPPLQVSDSRPELVSAIELVAEHPEARATGTERYDVAGRRGASRQLQRVRHALESTGDGNRSLCEQFLKLIRRGSVEQIHARVRGTDLVCERREIGTLVCTASDQVQRASTWGENPDTSDCGSRRRGGRVVHVSHLVDDRDLLEAVLDTQEPAETALDGVVRGAVRSCGRDRGERIQRSMIALQSERGRSFPRSFSAPRSEDELLLIP